MTIVLTDRIEKIIQRLLASGSYKNVDEIVQAGVEKLEFEPTGAAWPESFPPGSLRATLTDERNADEVALLKGSSLMIEDE